MVSVERQGWRRAPVGLLLLKGGVGGGAGCCSLLFSETIKWTVISPGRLLVSFERHLNPGTHSALFRIHVAADWVSLHILTS